MDQLKAMRLFVRVVERESFTRAASELGVSRAAATMAVRQLERQLHVILVQRTTRQVRPTPEGRSYYDQCLVILSLVDDAHSGYSQSRQPRGRLRVELPLSLARLLIIPALPRFYARYPEIQLEIRSGDRMVDLVREGVDCVVRIGDLSDSTLIARQLPSLRQVTCASMRYLADEPAPADPTTLRAHQIIGYRSATTDTLFPLEFSSGASIATPPATIVVNNGEAYVAACEAGLGIIQVPFYHVAEQLRSGSLVELWSDDPPPSLPMAILYPSARHLPTRLRCFINWLAEIVTS
jgi:LysR family transcriptional regulator, regulator for bpeEF and oprC